MLMDGVCRSRLTRTVMRYVAVPPAPFSVRALTLRPQSTDFSALIRHSNEFQFPIAAVRLESPLSAYECEH